MVMPAHSSSVAAPAEPCSLRGRASATLFGLLLFGLLTGCGNGGGGNGAPSTSGGNTLSGTAATGAPIVAGTVTFKDSVGATAGPIITDDFGNYSFGLGAKLSIRPLKFSEQLPWLSYAAFFV